MGQSSKQQPIFLSKDASKETKHLVDVVKGSHTKKPSRAAKSRTTRQEMIGDRYRLEGTYERIRRLLLEAPDDGRLDQTLSYWVLPTDRRLPIALLDKTVGELIKMPIESLLQTQGIGQKKILGLFDLLRRASESNASQAPFGLVHNVTNQKVNRYLEGAHRQPRSSEPFATGFSKTANSTKKSADKNSFAPVGRSLVDELEALPFDPGLVSEEVWKGWCDIVDRTGLGNQQLGRIAPTLRTLPTVIWHKKLQDYSQKSLAEIRQLKTHGSKRVNAILEVFFSVYEALSTSLVHEQLELRIVPRFVPQVTDWLVQANLSPESIKLKVFREKLVQPMVDQIANDLGEPIADLVARRLLVDSEPLTIKQQAEKLQVTRARVYQLVDDCAQVMQVRWPEGRWLIAPLASYENAEMLECDISLQRIVDATCDLFYPSESK